MSVKILITVSQHKRHKESSLLSKQQRLECVIEAEVAAAIDNDSNTRDDESTVQSHNAVRLECLYVYINHAIELSLCSLQPTPCHYRVGDLEAVALSSRLWP